MKGWKGEPGLIGPKVSLTLTRTNIQYCYIAADTCMLHNVTVMKGYMYMYNAY